MYWSRAAREAGAKLPGVMQDLGKARDPITGCRQPDISAANSLATHLRRQRCISRGVRVMACTAAANQPRHHRPRPQCSVCMRKAHCHLPIHRMAIRAPVSPPRLLCTPPHTRAAACDAHPATVLQRPCGAQRGRWPYLVCACSADEFFVRAKINAWA